MGEESSVHKTILQRAWRTRQESRVHWTILQRDWSKGTDA
jgi:hypothetical protein